MARPVTLVFRIAEEGVLHVGALADWQQDITRRSGHIQFIQ